MVCIRVLRFFTAFVFLMQYCSPQAFPDQLFHCLLLSKNHDIGLKKQNEIFTNRAMSWRALCFVVDTWSCLPQMCVKCWRPKPGSTSISLWKCVPCRDRRGWPLGLGGHHALLQTAGNAQGGPEQTVLHVMGPTRDCSLQALLAVFIQLHASFLHALAFKFSCPQVQLAVINPTSY